VSEIQSKVPRRRRYNRGDFKKSHIRPLKDPAKTFIKKFDECINGSSRRARRRLVKKLGLNERRFLKVEYGFYVYFGLKANAQAVVGGTAIFVGVLGGRKDEFSFGTMFGVCGQVGVGAGLSVSGIIGVTWVKPKQYPGLKFKFDIKAKLKIGISASITVNGKSASPATGGILGIDFGIGAGAGLNFGSANACVFDSFLAEAR